MTEDIDEDLDSLFGDTTPPKKEKPQKKEEEEQPKKQEKPEKKPETKPEKEKSEEEDTIPTKEEKPETPKKEHKPKEKPKEPKKEEQDNLFGDDDEEPPKVNEDSEFDTSPEEGQGKPVTVIYGRKGHGKTHFAYNFPGSISVLCFDDKSQLIAKKFNKKEGKDRIKVFNGTRYLDKKSEDDWLETANTSWRYIQVLLDKIEKANNTDWMMVDGGEITHQMLEMVMRYQNDLRAFQGIANKNVWKYRKMLIDQLLTRCTDIAKKGVIWTSYVRVQELVQDGDMVGTDEMPKWIDAVLYRTDTVIRVQRKTTKNGQRFYATVETSKWDAIKDTPRVDVTDKGLEKILAEGYTIEDI